MWNFFLTFIFISTAIQRFDIVSVFHWSASFQSIFHISLLNLSTYLERFFVSTLMGLFVIYGANLIPLLSLLTFLAIIIFESLNSYVTNVIKYLYTIYFQKFQSFCFEVSVLVYTFKFYFFTSSLDFKL